MKDWLDTLGVLDRLHLPAPGAFGVDIFKEWYHFHLIDVEHHIDLIANISLKGDVSRAGAGQADLILLIHQPDTGWLGGIDSFDGAAAQPDPRFLSIRVASSVSVTYTQREYRLALRSRDDRLELSAALRPQTEPLLLWNDTPLGRGSLNWLIAPDLEAEGTLRFSEHTVCFDHAIAYHDHNWGNWRWGDDFGWQWGFGTHAPDAVQDRTTTVFDRTSDRGGAVSLEHTLAIWRRHHLAKVFTRKMLRCERDGRFAGPIPVRPGVARLIAQGQVTTVPRVLRISARDGGDWLDLAYEIEAALQIAVPNDFGFGLVGLNETVGRLAVRGELRGESVAYETRAAFEFLC